MRHGENEANRDNITCGYLDSPLTERGREQAAKTRDDLKNVDFHAVYSSDLQRTIITAEIIAGQPVPPERQLKDLRERDFGELEGKPGHLWKDIYEQFEATYGHLPTAEKWKHRYAPYIESSDEMSTRFLNSLNKIAAQHQGETVLIGTHMGCIRTTLIKLGFADEGELPPGSFENAGFVVLSHNGRDMKIEEVVGAKIAA